MPIAKKFTKSPDLSRQRHAKKVHTANFILNHARQFPCFTARELTRLWNRDMPAVYPRIKGSYMSFRCDALVTAGYLVKIRHGVFARLGGGKITPLDVGVALYPDTMAFFERRGERGASGHDLVAALRGKSRSILLREAQALTRIGALRKVFDKTRPPGEREFWRVHLAARPYPIPTSLPRAPNRQKYMRSLIAEDRAQDRIVDPFTGEPLQTTENP